jgi:4-hydroxybenzoate polyprenyltransferase
VSKVKVFFEMIKFEHSIFALPFAYLGMVLASNGLPTLPIFIAVTLAMVSARTFGMTLNRIIDREIDSRNPRTKKRALPAETLSLPFAWMVVGISLLVFMISIYPLPNICWYLSPLALVAMWVYPFLKRFTWLSHCFLGLILAMTPIGAWLAVRGTLGIIPVVLAMGVAFWVAGFDILYSLQDYHSDKEENLFSFPVRWGRKRALQVSGWFHVGTLCAFAAVLVLSSAGLWAWAGFLIIGVMILREHRILIEVGLEKLQDAFFVSNAWVSVVYFSGILLDKVL